MNFPKRGFTIIELLMAMGVFIFVIISALGIYIIAIQRHYQAQKIQLVTEELRFAMELISNDIKNSDIIAAKDEYPTGGDGLIDLIYLDYPDKNIDSNSCNDSSYTGCFQYKIDYANKDIRASGAGDGGNFIPLTSQNIEIIEGSQFYVDATPYNEQELPKVTILIKAKAKNDTENISDLILQTTISQRKLENRYQGLK